MSTERRIPLRSRSIAPHLGYLLTAPEVLRAEYYQCLWQERTGRDPAAEAELVFNLGDNPDGGWCTWSAPALGSSVFQVPTFRRNWTVLWLPALRRWLTQKERLALMGFPSYEPLARAYGTTTMHFTRDECKQALGNCMHVANIGAWQAVVAACVRLNGADS